MLYYAVESDCIIYAALCMHYFYIMNWYSLKRTEL